MSELTGFKSLDQFTEYLNQYVDLGSWGVGGAKSPAELWEELHKGDSGLVKEDNGILRLTWPIFIDVLYQDQGTDFHCYEATSKKGKFRDLPGTYAEKRQANEDLDEAISRTYDEEINNSLPQSGLSLKDSSLGFQKKWEENTGARSYPGLQTKSINTLFALNLAPNQGEPKPFILVEKNGITKFDWEVQK